MPVDKKVAVVTGGGSGIGRAIAVRLAGDGGLVAVWDLDGPGAEETVRRIEAEGGRAIACEVDASSSAGIAEAVRVTRQQLGAITILVNNAAISESVPFHEMAEEAWDRMIRINLKGPFLCTKAIIPDMLEAGWGRIVNISSSSAQAGSPYMSHYVASKGGVIGFTKALAIEYAASGITVNNIPPGYVDTPMSRRTQANHPVRKSLSDDNHDQLLAAHFPMKRAGRPEEIAAACAYLVSDDAGYVTGQTLSVNGGRYLV